MSDALTLDLFIQDFVTTNKILNSHYDWSALVNRRFLEDGLTKVFRFESGGGSHCAIGRHLALPDADWFRIELTRAIPQVDEHRFDCLRMTQAGTHTGLVVEALGPDTVLVKLTTRHRGLVNVVFVIRDGMSLGDPFLV
jgi:hypothetical protein